MALLDADAKAAFYAAFSSIYLDGTLTSVGLSFADNGDVIEARTNTAIKCHQNPAKEDSSGEYARADICLIVLQEGVADINPDDEIEFQGTTYSIFKVTRDPANLYYKVWGTC